MLTWEQLEKHVVDGRLMKWTCGLKQTPDAGRVLYVLPEVYEALTQKPWPASDGERHVHTKERRQAMRQVLERFVKGHAMLVNREVKELGSASMLTHMRGYWEFRSMGRMEETRLFGFFARTGAFVATAFCARGSFTKQADWDRRRQLCDKLWAGIFPNDSFLDEPWPVNAKPEMNSYLDRVD